MKDEEILKIFNYSFELVLLSKYVSEFPNLPIYCNGFDTDSIKYKDQRYSIGLEFYKDILFQIGISKSHDIDKDNKIIGEKTTIEDYYNIQNEFKQNKEYIIVSDEIEKPKISGTTKSLIRHVSYLMKKNDDKIIMISFQEETFNENLSDYLSHNVIQVFQMPYSIYLVYKNKEQEKIYEVLEQFVNSYLKQ
ncbi:MAG: hypothetical protein KBG82_08460 [Spirochaetes bacterium]|nr:hypothetical protein [Spirochaetota bacterium]